MLNRSTNPYGGNAIKRENFLDEIQSRGEHMTDYELADCLSNLMHANYQVDELSPDELSHLIDKHLPRSLTVDKFMTDLIGIPTENFEEILQTWEKIRVANTPRVATTTATTNAAGAKNNKSRATRQEMTTRSQMTGEADLLLKEDYDRLESARLLKSEVDVYQSRATNYNKNSSQLEDYD